MVFTSDESSSVFKSFIASLCQATLNFPLQFHDSIKPFFFKSFKLYINACKCFVILMEKIH